MIHPNACTSTLSGILIPIINNQKFWDQHKILTHPSPKPTFCPERWNYGREGEVVGFLESPLRAGLLLSVTGNAYCPSRQQLGNDF